MKLYYFPGSCALAPHIVLEWLGEDFEPVRIEKGDPAFLEVNPLGTVPAIEADGRVYTQADAILHWLADTHPDADLLGGESAEDRYELNNWMAFLTGDLHPAFFPFFNPHRYTTANAEDQLAAVKSAAGARVAKYYEFLDEHLAGREFLAGDRRSIADAYAVPMLRWGRLLDEPLASYPALQGFLARWEQDAGVVRAMQAQGLVR